MLLEICASSYQSAINAQNAGANRIELCSELALGGITPSYGLIKKVIENLSIPVHVLIRPRSGNFTYSEEEFEIIKTDIKLCKKLGCQGIVSGVLKADNTIDVIRTQELIELSKPLSFTFHRAFDWIENSSDAVEQLIAIGANRILTSGKKSSAQEGIVLLKELEIKAQNKLLIFPGGGINSENVLTFKEAGFKEIHCSASKIEYLKDEGKIPMNSSVFFNENSIVHSDYDKIKNIVDLIR
ncbi:copper homeostasis protein [Flavobacterium glycines]|uniref:PF03932 family protein CutC n=1 Tax=Flavobacterium glycines TaxID=551990 RepID=A0A1B9DZ95_9FLAO|nr:copper homeostasis protein CutC [Flavobacterium glycines]OCB75006.1 copper homeostasis protein CutC [Flavobacterium glycines]GEL11299.1 copper homeostasis protein CutC [Flavobacterium glycines]SDJ42798.1 copper homeostasis protein [Flavobacterium glycines]